MWCSAVRRSGATVICFLFALPTRWIRTKEARDQSADCQLSFGCVSIRIRWHGALSTRDKWQRASCFTFCTRVFGPKVSIAIVRLTKTFKKKNIVPKLSRLVRLVVQQRTLDRLPRAGIGRPRGQLLGRVGSKEGRRGGRTALAAAVPLQDNG